MAKHVVPPPPRSWVIECTSDHTFYYSSTGQWYVVVEDIDQNPCSLTPYNLPVGEYNTFVPDTTPVFPSDDDDTRFAKMWEQRLARLAEGLDPGAIPDPLTGNASCNDEEPTEGWVWEFRLGKRPLRADDVSERMTSVGLA